MPGFTTIAQSSQVTRITLEDLEVIQQLPAVLKEGFTDRYNIVVFEGKAFRYRLLQIGSGEKPSNDDGPSRLDAPETHNQHRTILERFCRRLLDSLLRGFN